MRPRLPLALILASLGLAAPPAWAQTRPHKPDAARPDEGKPDATKPAAKPDPAKPAPGAKADPGPRSETRDEANKYLAKQADARVAELLKHGVEACERGDIDEGLPLLNSALARRIDAETLGAVAGCEARAGRFAAAADHYLAALRLKEEGPERKALEEAFADVRKRVGALAITINADGADVLVGTRVVGVSPLPAEVFVDPGKDIAVIVKKAGYDEVEKHVDVAAQRSVAVKIELVQSPSSGNRYFTPQRSRVPFYVLGGAALVAGGVGGALYASAASKGSAADAILTALNGGDSTKHPCDAPTTGTVKRSCATLTDLRQGHDTMANISTGVFIGGGVLLGAAILTGVWALSAPGPTSTGGASAAPRAASITLAPSVSPDGAGLWLQGAF
jgi:hypothetical protein